MTEGVMRDGVLRNGREECRKSHTVSPMADGSIAFTDVKEQAGEKTPGEWQCRSNRRHW